MGDEFTKTAIEAAQKGGAVLLDYYNRLQSLQVKSKGRSDYVTEADLAAQESIVSFIRRRHPDHTILAEESKAVADRNESRWLIDPLDGTTNFIHGFPVFAVSIALEQKGSIVLGVVYDPCREELFLAEKGQGGTLNGRSIRVSSRKQASESLVATAFPFKQRSILPLYLKGFNRVFERVSDTRRTGSAALDLSYVACGRLDGFWELGLSPWDVAAGDLLVREAGGVISDFSGGDHQIWVGDVIAANPAIHPLLLEILKDVFGGNVSKPRD
jgi:myo-inositol-1(or 4)-monophosphatase